MVQSICPNRIAWHLQRKLFQRNIQKQETIIFAIIYSPISGEKIESVSSHFALPLITSLRYFLFILRLSLNVTRPHRCFLILQGFDMARFWFDKARAAKFRIRQLYAHQADGKTIPEGFERTALCFLGAAISHVLTHSSYNFHPQNRKISQRCCDK